MPTITPASDVVKQIEVNKIKSLAEAEQNVKKLTMERMQLWSERFNAEIESAMTKTNVSGILFQIRESISALEDVNRFVKILIDGGYSVGDINKPNNDGWGYMLHIAWK